MARLKGLGRGLDALLSGDDAPREVLKNLPVAALKPGRYQPRTRFDEAGLAALAESIRTQGVMQPVLVRPVAGGRHEIIAGERRWRAAQAAGLKEIPALVREVSDEAALAMALIENIQRENLGPLEEAAGLQRLIEEFGLTHAQAAQAVGRSRSAVTNLLRLLQLAAPVRDLLAQGHLDMGHGRALLSLKEPQQIALAEQIVAHGWSVREAEQRAAYPAGLAKAKTAPRRKDPDVARLQEEISQRLGASVRIEAGKKGGGRILIRFTNLDHLDSLLKRL